MDLEDWSKHITNNQKLMLFLGKFLLAFEKNTRELKKQHPSIRTRHNLSIRIMMFLLMNRNVKKTDIMKAMRSHHSAVTAAMLNLKTDGHLCEEVVMECQTKNKIRVKSSIYSLSLKGEDYINAFVKDIINTI